MQSTFVQVQDRGSYINGKVSVFALQFCSEGKLNSQHFISPSNNITMIFSPVFFLQNNMHKTHVIHFNDVHGSERWNFVLENTGA